MTGGGTGGHIYPAIAIAKALQKIDHNVEILFVGTKRGLEKELVPKNGYDIELITVSGFNRKNLLKNFKTLKDLAKGNREAKKIIKNFKPDVVIGTGGYVCGPVVRAASKMGIKTFIHEQNAFPGMTNKLLEKYVEKVFISFEPARQYFKDSEKLILTGNPVRREFYEVNKKTAREKLDLELDKFIIMAFGGSQGAKNINNISLELLKKINGTENIAFIFVTGKFYHDSIKEMIAEEKIEVQSNIRILEYIDDMASYLGASDVIISRSGALAVSEITVCGKPSILIPSPNVTGNHQYFNAKSVEETGGAFLIEEKNLNFDIVYEKINLLLNDEKLRTDMSNNCKSAAPKDAAKIIAEYVFNDM